MRTTASSIPRRGRSSLSSIDPRCMSPAPSNTRSMCRGHTAHTPALSPRPQAVAVLASAFVRGNLGATRPTTSCTRGTDTSAEPLFSLVHTPSALPSVQWPPPAMPLGTTGRRVRRGQQRLNLRHSCRDVCMWGCGFCFAVDSTLVQDNGNEAEPTAREEACQYEVGWGVAHAVGWDKRLTRKWGRTEQTRKEKRTTHPPYR